MTTWETQELEEAECAAIWERINAPHPEEEVLKSSAKTLKKAVEVIGNAEDLLFDAVTELSETSGEDYVSSLLNDLQSLNVQINELRRKFERGHT